MTTNCSACGVTLRSGESLAGDFVVLAVPFKNVLPLVPEHVRKRLPALDLIESLQASPITGVHFWFDRAICPFDHVATPGTIDPVGVQPYGDPGARCAGIRVRVLVDAPAERASASRKSRPVSASGHQRVV